MAQTKQQKQKILEELKEKINKQKVVVFFDFSGLKVKDLSDLRKRLRKENSELKVAKKTLLSLAFKKLDEVVAKNIKKLTGEIALVFGYQDTISPAKTLWQFSKDFPNLKILAGFVENEFKEADEIMALAQLPSRQELLARLAWSIAGPISGFVNVLQGNIKGLMYALSAIKK
jgi:large subunit ribosomal protein L10